MRSSSKGKIAAERLEPNVTSTVPVVLLKPGSPTDIPVLDQDVRIEVYHSAAFGRGKVKMFQVTMLLLGDDYL